ncbi:DNA methylase N-4 [Brevibacterium sp. Re57]|uniref:DNA methylase N-4 n=2 Tax=Brevibacterium gallinarum TaxID=2762220 RepID=A0ABR8WRN0_9MICO|nr:DNA methylase N-4 [Brevibacterium gallinarum]
MWRYRVIDEKWLTAGDEPEVDVDLEVEPGESVSYEEFLRRKVAVSAQHGFRVELDDLHPALKEHQRLMVQWALAGGRRAIFAAFGMGKSIMQLEALRQIREREGGPVLVVCPLGVRIEFAADAGKVDVETRFIRRSAEVDSEFAGVYLTNYESVRDGKLDPALFTAVSLDEASVLRSFGSKTYQAFLTLFDDVRFRFVATATPSPNRYKELIHYAGYLGVMDTGQALTRFFQRDSTKANNLTLYPHKEREFYLWLNTWACFVQSPADLGCDVTGYDLPELRIDFREVEISLADETTDRDGQGFIFRSADLGLKEAAREKRLSIDKRVSEAMRIVTAETSPFDSGEQVIVWCDLNDEQDAIEAALQAAGISFSSIRGSLSADEVERRLIEWKARETTVLIGKPVMLGQGMNLQQCNRAVFLGVTYKFNDTIQAVHRIHRYGQTRACHVHLIHANSEIGVVRELREKWAKDRELKSRMSDVIREYGLDSDAIAAELTRAMGVERIVAAGEGWEVANNDCVDEVRRIGDGEVDLIVTSIPFSNHYEYTPSYNDFGHTDDNAHFWSQMDYLTPELLRVLQPGRIYACHVKDRILFGNVTGAGVPTSSPFHAEAIMHGLRHGFDYMGMITVVTDVVRENNQTYRLGWSEQCKDATKMGAGSPEYILLFHKPQTDRTKGYADVPVTKAKAEYSRARWQVDAHAFWRSSGQRNLTTDELASLPPEQLSRTFTEQTLRQVYDYESHITIGEALDGKGALPATFMSLAPGSWHPEVWHDVNRMRTLNGEQARRSLQMHVCPLQFDIVDRLIERFSNPGDLVFDPFGGLMTVPVRALRAGRRGRAAELNTGYFLDGVKYLEAEERKHDMPGLFDLEGIAS